MKRVMSVQLVAFALVAGACGSVSETPKPDAAKPAVDAPTAVDAAIDGMVAPFTPAELSGLALWLEAGQSVVANQGKVSTWMDRSGRNNNAGQPIAMNQPTLVPNVANGLPVIRFNATALVITDSLSLQWATDDFAVLVVASYKNPPSGTFPYGMIVAKQSVPYPYAGPSLWGNYTLPSINTGVGMQLENTASQYTITTAGKNDGVLRLYTGRRAGTKLELRVNGTVQGMVTATPNNVSAGGSPFYIGGSVGTNNVVSQGLDGDIAEIVAVHGMLSAADLTKLESYLKTKYAL